MESKEKLVLLSRIRLILIVAAVLLLIATAVTGWMAFSGDFTERRPSEGYKATEEEADDFDDETDPKARETTASSELSNEVTEPTEGEDVGGGGFTNNTDYDPNYAGNDNSGGKKDNKDKPGTDKPGTDTPGTDTPGTDTPGTDTPGTDQPGTGGGGGGEVVVPPPTPPEQTEPVIITPPDPDA